MKKTIKTNFTEAELRQIIREEVRAVLNNEDNQVAGTDQEGFINLDQAAEFLKVAKQTLYTKTSAGTIPFTKKGKRLLFKKSELAAWLNVPTIENISYKLLSHNERAILFELATADQAYKFDQLLDGFTIRWGEESPGRFTVTLRSPAIGSYQKDVSLNLIDHFKNANCIAAVYKNDAGELISIDESRPLEGSYYELK